MAEQINTGRVERRRLYPAISFITVDADCKPWECKGLRYFDVPPQEYDDGCMTGTMACCELVASPDGFSHLAGILEEAVSHLAPTAQISRRGAVVGFMCTLEEILKRAAAELDLSGLFQRDFAYYQEEVAEGLAAMKKDHARLLASLPQRAEQAPVRKQGGRRRKGAA
jgi:hypothetical protein